MLRDEPLRAVWARVAGHRHDPGRERRAAPELADGARIYHLRGCKHRARTGAGAVGAPRHFVLYRVLEPDLVGVARILHDSMDLPAHATDDFGKG